MNRKLCTGGPVQPATKGKTFSSACESCETSHAVSITKKETEALATLGIKGSLE